MFSEAIHAPQAKVVNAEESGNKFGSISFNTTLLCNIFGHIRPPEGLHCGFQNLIAVLM